MSRYGAAAYGVSVYGKTPELQYSVSPVTITVLSFSSVYLNWFQPSGTFSKFRIIRNQNQFPETEEDGLVIFEQSSTDGSSIEGKISTNEFTDGVDNPTDIGLLSGSQVYYGFFLFTDSKVWVNAGYVSDIVPFNTDAITKTLNLFPRVAISEQVAPLGTVSEASPIYKIMDAFSFTYEQLMTFLTLLRPEHKRDKTLYATLPTESLNLGLSIEPNLPVTNQHRLIREAIYLYKNRGTKKGLEGYAEALTGFTPAATVSTNLLLTVQDSTFYKGIGNWTATNATLTSSTDLSAATGTNVIDLSYTGKLVATNAGLMSLGASNIKTKCIPIAPGGTQYIVSCKVKSPSSAGNVVLSIRYYDKDGVATSAAHSSSSVAANNTWKTVSVVSTTDSASSYALVTISYDAAGTYYFDQVCLQRGSSVNYDEARAVTLSLEPKKINKILNPSFEVNSNTWTVTGATFSKDISVSPDAYSGSFSGKFVAGGAWDITTNYHIPLSVGLYYTFSFYAKSTNINQLTITVKTYDVSDVLIDTKTTNVSIDSSWKRYHLSDLINSESTETYAVVTISGTAGTAYVDMVQFEDTYKPTDYFDGSLPPEYGSIWIGTAHQSESYIYPGRLTKIPRLAYTITDWLPSNTFWRITIADNTHVEYTNLTV